MESLEQRAKRTGRVIAPPRDEMNQENLREREQRLATILNPTLTFNIQYCLAISAKSWEEAWGGRGRVTYLPLKEKGAGRRGGHT